MTTLTSVHVGHHYRPLLELARDRTSDSYLAATLTSGVQKLWVLKLLHPELRDEPRERAAFHREAALATQLEHPNAAYVFGLVEHEGAPAILMEYLEGVPLSRILGHASASLPIRLHILTQVLAALHYCHELSDLDGNPLRAAHLDVSPRNVVVLHEGAVKVIGFGSARVGAPLDENTPRTTMSVDLTYLAPEQLQGVELDRRTDIYAVGVMLWEALAERPFWQGSERAAIVQALRRGSLPSLEDVAPNTPKRLQQVVQRALHPDREKRFQSALALLHALEEAASETVGLARPLALADFMKQCFDTERHAQRQTVALAMQQPIPPNFTVATSADPRSAVSPWFRGRRTAMVVALALLLVGLLWASRATLGSHARPHSTPLAVPRSEEAVRPTPAGENGAKPLEQSSPLPSGALEAVPEAPTTTLAAPEGATVPALGNAEDDAAIPRRRTPGGTARTPPPAASGPSDHCTPPYRLMEDGVKAFKPECF